MAGLGVPQVHGGVEWRVANAGDSPALVRYVTATSDRLRKQWPAFLEEHGLKRTDYDLRPWPKEIPDLEPWPRIVLRQADAPQLMPVTAQLLRTHTIWRNPPSRAALEADRLTVFMLSEPLLADGVTWDEYSPTQRLKVHGWTGAYESLAPAILADESIDVGPVARAELEYESNDEEEPVGRARITKRVYIWTGRQRHVSPIGRHTVRWWGPAPVVRDWIGKRLLLSAPSNGEGHSMTAATRGAPYGVPGTHYLTPQPGPPAIV